MEGNQMKTDGVQPLELLVANDAVATCEKMESDFRNKGDYCHNNIGSKTSGDWERMDKFLVDAADEIRSVRDCVESLVALYSRQKLRQCDVGTADEQLPRFVAAWESAHRSVVDRRSMMMLSVFSRWAQMPYKAERKGETDGK